MRASKFILTAAIFTVFSASQTNAAFFTYAEWERLSADSRAAYIAGAYDSLTTFASAEMERSIKVAQHYRACVVRTKITNHQLAENVRAYAATKPELQAMPVPAAMLHYLLALCGEVP